MQTFLPYASFQKSAAILDNQRLGKQRVEAMQILKALSDPAYGWQSHPAVRMWQGYEDALAAYMNVMILEWERRGFKNNMKLCYVEPGYELPWWFGYVGFHDSHQSNLAAKAPGYRGIPGWEPPGMPYWWPENLTHSFKLGKKKAEQGI